MSENIDDMMKSIHELDKKILAKQSKYPVPNVGDEFKIKMANDPLQTAQDDGYVLAESGITSSITLSGDTTILGTVTGNLKDADIAILGMSEVEELIIKPTDKVNALHNPDAPQTQEEIDAAWARHKAFIGR